MTVRYRGRIPVVDPDHPEAWGKDDITGLPVMHTDMIKQMEYIGNGLAWTGFMVHHKDADQPNPQLIPPRLKPDPLPIDNPRYLQFPELPSIPTGLTVTGFTSTSITVTWDQVPGIPSYVIGWTSIWSFGETRGIVPTTYTINGLSPGNTYAVAVASTANNTSETTNEFTTSAFSPVISVTLPTL
jgi:hypothetical protein